MSSRERHLGNLISTANERARTLEAQNQGQPVATGLNGGEGPLLDSITNISHGLMAEPGNRSGVEAGLANYMRVVESAVDSRTSLGQAMIGDARSAVGESLDLINATDWSKAKGVLGKPLAVLGLAIAVEQKLSAPFSRIPFPALPAVRVWDLSIGLPHGHAHPPTNGTPWPSIGPILKIGLFGVGISGAMKTKINGEFAARCGDLGVGLWCGGYFPIYTILLGSSSVWIEGARAARMAVDVTLHCIGTRLKAITDAPLGIPLGFPVGLVGLTGTVNTNVIIGGFPLPSLTSLILGLALRPVFAGLGIVARRISPRLDRAAIVNSIRYVNRPGIKAPGRFVNCGKCVVAVDDILSGVPARGVRAAPGRVGCNWWQDFINRYGRGFQTVRSQTEVENIMHAAGPGARGIIYHGWPNTNETHVINVINRRGTIMYLDGQIGKRLDDLGGRILGAIIRTN
jgi:hypothetical protein